MSNRPTHWMPVGTSKTASGKAACGARVGFRLKTSIFTDNVTCTRCKAVARRGAVSGVSAVSGPRESAGLNNSEKEGTNK